MPAVALNTGTVATLADQDGTVTSIKAGTQLNLAAGTSTELVILLTFQNNVVSTFSGTYGAKALVSVGGPVNATSTGFSSAFHVSAPATGLQTLAGSWTGTSDYVIFVAAFDNAAGGLGHFNSNSGNSTSASVAITTNAATDAVICCVQNTSTQAPLSPNGTEIGGALSANSINSTASYLLTPSTPTQTMSASLVSDFWLMYGLNIINVAASSCLPGSRMLLGVGCGIWAAKKLEENPRLTRRRLILPR